MILGFVMLTVYIDLGSSETRCVFWRDGVQVLWMSPQVVPLDAAGLSRFDLEGLGVPPEERAFLEVGGSAFAVGTLARLHRGRSYLEAPKADWAVVKVLAALGVILGEQAQPQSEVVDLGVLLPLEEYWRDGSAFREQLVDAVQSFRFRGHKTCCTLRRLEVLPEGAGIFYWHAARLERGGWDFRRRVIAVLVLGHRNLSVLTFDHGNPPLASNSTSSGPGYIEVLARCAEHLPGVPAEDANLLEAVVERRVRFRAQGRVEAVDLDAARQQGEKLYLSRVREFLKGAVPVQGAPDVLICGGPAQQLKAELIDVFGTLDLTVHWPEELVTEAAGWVNVAQPGSVKAVRLVDCYAAFKRLLSRAGAS